VGGWQKVEVTSDENRALELPRGRLCEKGGATFEPGRPFTGVSQPTFVNRLPHPRSTTRSIALLSYTSAVVTVDDADDCDYSFRRFRVRI
jgi:hypothetical protein